MGLGRDLKASRLHTRMAWKHFADWLDNRNYELDYLLRLWEVSGEFPRGELNALMNAQVDKLIAQTQDPETKQELQQAQQMDWIGYIDRAARNAGVKDYDLDGVVHDTIVRLLVSPGTLFSGWSGQNLKGRFVLSVRNALLNHRAARMTRKKRIPSMSIHGGGEAAMDVPAPKSMAQTLLDEFRAFLLDRHGEQAVQVFDQRVGGGDVKDLVGDGLTSYGVKQLVQKIKTAAREFASDDPEFLGMIEKALEDEARTVARRFARKQN